MRVLFSVILLCFACSGYAQKEANFWYFGENAGLDFSTAPPTAVSGQLNTYEGCSTISDSNGNLLFYSDGRTVWDRNNEIMKFYDGSPGINLKGNDSSTQSALIVPKPGDENLFYLFTVGSVNGVNNPGFHYYTIDKSKNNNLGEIISEPIDLSKSLSGNWSEKVTAVAGKECETFWVISADEYNFYSYKVDRNGVNPTPIVSSLGGFTNTTRGYLKVSPDGKYIVLANQQDNTYLFEFNTQDGTVNNKMTLNVSQGGYGVEFSATSKMLYISTGRYSQPFQGQLPDPDAAFIYQFNLNNNSITEINSSRKVILSEDGFRGALQLGIDGKIYYARARKSHLGIINFPDKIGGECQYVAEGVQLAASTVSSEGLPPFIQSFFSPVKIIDSETKSVNLTNETNTICAGESLRIEPELEGNAASTFQWTKDDDPTVLFTSRKITIDDSNFGSGTYHLEMNIIDDCGRSNKYNGSVKIAFVALPELSAVPVYEQCDFDNNPTDGIAAFNLESKIAGITNNAAGLSIDFFEETDTSFSSPIPNPSNYRNTTSTNGPGVYHKIIVRATNSTGCVSTQILELKAKATSLDVYPDLYLTETDLNADNIDARNSVGLGSATYDFNQKTKDIIDNSGGAFSLSTHTFAYYSDVNDATLEINEIEASSQTTSFTNNSPIFVRIATNGSSSCSGVGEFKIYVNERPIAQGDTAPTYLCVNNPIDNPQMKFIPLDATTDNPTDTYQWYFNGNKITGAINAIHNATVQGTYRVEAYRIYENGSTDASDDTVSNGYNTFDVIESNAARIVSTTITDNLDNPDANILEVLVEGIGDYVYALNSRSFTAFQKGEENLSFTFNDVKPGINAIYIKDLNGCEETSSSPLSFLFFQRHFTPNNDGIYDTWKISGSNSAYYTSSRVEIFDRYGKVVALLKDGSQWNGTYNGRKLPAADYWFNAVLEDINGNVRKETGSFSLIRE